MGLSYARPSIHRSARLDIDIDDVYSDHHGYWYQDFYGHYDGNDNGDGDRNCEHDANFDVDNHCSVSESEWRVLVWCV